MKMVTHHAANVPVTQTAANALIPIALAKALAARHLVILGRDKFK